MPLGYFSLFLHQMIILPALPQTQGSKVKGGKLLFFRLVTRGGFSLDRCSNTSRCGFMVKALIIITCNNQHTHRRSRLAPPTPGAALKSGHIICPFLSGLLCGAVRCDECSRSRAKPPPVRGWFLTNLAARVKISSAWLVSITAHQLLPHLQSDGTGGMEAHFCPQMETHSLQTSERFNLLCILGALSLY